MSSGLSLKPVVSNRLALRLCPLLLNGPHMMSSPQDNGQSNASSSSNNGGSDPNLPATLHSTKRPQEPKGPEESIHLPIKQPKPQGLLGILPCGPYPNQYLFPQLAYCNYGYNGQVAFFAQPQFVQPNLSYQWVRRENASHTQTRSVHTAPKVTRSWEKIATNRGNTGYVFTVMSYNVLAQDLLNMHPQLYMVHEQKFLQWNSRWRNLLREIKQANPDILCLQEVQGTHLSKYYSAFNELGYQGVFKQRTGTTSDGCAIYYKTKQLTLLEHTTVEYYQPNVPLLDRHNVAIIARLAPKKNPVKQFLVATTHLLFNPKRQDVRLAQTQILLTELDRLAFSKSGYLPVIVNGDLNSTPDSAVYQFLAKGQLQYENLEMRTLQNRDGSGRVGKKFLPQSLRITDQCQHADLIDKRLHKSSLTRSEELRLIELQNSENRADKIQRDDTKNSGNFASGTLSHSFELKSVYGHKVNDDWEGTTFQNQWITVDYIFYSTRNGDARLTLLKRFKLPTSSELNGTTIPNATLGSDHLSLLATFKLE